MGLVLFTVMIAVPILEITVFILVGRYIGLWPTLVRRELVEPEVKVSLQETAP